MGRPPLALSPNMEAICSKNKQAYKTLRENFLLLTEKRWLGGGGGERNTKSCGTEGNLAARPFPEQEVDGGGGLQAEEPQALFFQAHELRKVTARFPF